MSIDVNILRVMRHRDDYFKMITAVPKTGLDDRTKGFLDDFKRYFDKFPDAKVIDKQEFASMYFNFWHPKMTQEDKGIHARIILNFSQPVDQAVRDNLVNSMLQVSFSMRAAQLLQKFEDGADVDIVRDIKELSEQVSLQVERRIKIPFVDDDIHDLLQEDADDSGLHWRLECLNRSMRPLRGGDFGIIAGRPDSGKTSFLTSELSFMAAQLPEAYPEEERQIIWFNNEGPGSRIKKRFWQSALGVDIDKMVEYSQDGSIIDRYVDAVGDINRMRILDIHDFWSYDILDVLDQLKPGLIVFDMIDNIKFSGEIGSGSRTDQVLEAQYQWARLLGVKFDCPVLATSQISNDGAGELFPTLGMLKDSKTGKQGACDFQLMIGKSNAEEMSNVRGIGLPKNKLQRPNQKKDPKELVTFHETIGRYVTAEDE